jgi:outer membrane lipoprotein-sorting protein
MKTHHFLIALIVCAFQSISFSFAQSSLSPKQIIEKAYYNERSDAYALSITIKLIRPSWTRELSTKTFAKGERYGMMLITAPAKDKGASFLRVQTEGWSWLPSVERVVKISPSQMSQSWMGSDYTNEDLLKEAAIVHDYSHRLLAEEEFGGVKCFKIEAKPNDGAAVVWGKKLIWIGKDDLLERKTENYDEDGALVSTLTKSGFTNLGGKKIATTLEMLPSNKPNQKTVITISSADFKATLGDEFFTQEMMKRVK